MLDHDPIAMLGLPIHLSIWQQIAQEGEMRDLLRALEAMDSIHGSEAPLRRRCQ
jgi:hypothetical protein